MKKVSKSAIVRKMLAAGKSVETIVKQAKVTPAHVYTLRWQMAQGKKPPKKKVAEASAPVKSVKDEINHPEHYTYGGIETWDFIEAKALSYHLASVVKYVSRAGRKEGNTELKDLKKAREHLDRRIKQLVSQYPV